MYAAGQNFVSGHAIRLLQRDRQRCPTSTFTADVANGQNQRTILIGDTGVAAAPTSTDSSARRCLDASGGAVCFEDPVGTVRVDCVAWGTFANAAHAPGRHARRRGFPTASR